MTTHLRILQMLLLLLFIIPINHVNSQSINFSVSALSGGTVGNPTSLMFGPDFRLYVSYQFGTIKVFTIDRQGKDNYIVTNTETINTIQSVPNYDDDGERNYGVNNRQITGIYTTGTANNPVIYVSHSDPRQGGGSGGIDKNLDTNSGMISKLTWTGDYWEKVDIVRGLPRSEENHAPNGMALDETTNTLFIGIGGFTNAGAPSAAFTYICEYTLAAAILSIDLNVIESLPIQYDEGQAYQYNIPTMDDPTRPGNEDKNDPFGGNDGLNMAKIVPGGPVQVYSPGWRNPYDVVITESGKLYSVDNGANLTWGGYPKNEGGGDVTNEYVVNEPGYVNNLNGLHYVSEKGYYAGHPHPIRANPYGAGLYTDNDGEGVWRNSKEGDYPLPSDWPPVLEANPVEGDFRQPGQGDGSLVVYVPSTNGLCEYSASNFGGALKGDLITAGLTGEIFRADLNEAGDQVTNGVEVLAEGFGYIPLDVIAVGDDNGPFPGTIWVADFGDNSIYVLEPADYGGATVQPCFGDYSAFLDDDGDGFKNADEIDNGTNPCSASSKPADADSDFVSDMNDSDDDNDGIADVNDAFALDPENGLNTSIPLLYDMLNGDPGFGFFGLGLTGIMTNGETDYLDQYDQENIVAGGTSGLLTPPTTNGDAIDNNQDNAFQFGINIDENQCPFTIQSRLKTPIFPAGGPYGTQSQGIFIGTGDQDNYIKVIVDEHIRVIQEDEGIVSSIDHIDPDISSSDPNFIDLFITVYPNSGHVQASYQLGSDKPIINAGPIIKMGSKLKEIVKESQKALAVGVISTSKGADSFRPTWDFIDISQSDIALGNAGLLIDSNEGIHSSVHKSGSFSINNLASQDQDITKVSIDLSSAVIPDLVFDTDGNTNDELFKIFSPDGGSIETGFIRVEFSKENGQGFQKVDIYFDDFNPNEMFSFSIDIDPSNVKDNHSGNISTLGEVSPVELTGAEVGFEYEFCGEQFTHIMPSPEDIYGSLALTLEDPINEPILTVEGVSNGSQQVYERNKLVTVSQGPHNGIASVFLLNAVGSGNNANDAVKNVISIKEYEVSLDENGEGVVDVRLNASSLTNLVNYLVAVVESESHELKRNGDSEDDELLGQLANLKSTHLVSSSLQALKVVPEPCDLIRINAGGENFTTSTGLFFEADKDFDRGDSWGGSWVGEIDDTEDDLLFQTERSQSTEGFTYNIPVSSNGIYSVKLYFAELFHQSENSRVFDVNAEGGEIEFDDLDIYSEVGFKHLLIKTFDIVVSDGVLDIEFISEIDQPKVSALSVSKACQGTLLPVEILNFSAKVQSSEVLLEWITTSEINNDYFLIERSVDGIYFDPLDKIQGVGNSDQASSYSFMDVNPLIGQSYYRLAQLDNDGSMNLSNILSVQFNSSTEEIRIHPNPVENQLVKMHLQGFQQNSSVIIDVLDITGKTVQSHTIRSKDSNGYIEEINLKGVSSGIYFIRIEGKAKQIHKISIK